MWWIPLTFLLTAILLSYWIRIAHERGLVGKDMNKYEEYKVAESGGTPLLLIVPSLISILVFYYPEKAALILGAALTSLLAGIIGFIDDVLGWMRGLPQWLKPLLSVLAAIPLAVLSLYFDFGGLDVPRWLYMLLIVVGVVGASNAFNMLAGFNGLEAGLSIILFATLGVKLYFMGEYWLVNIITIFLAAAIAFFLYNKYPAKVFPGDSFTYFSGALYASVAILGGIEWMAVLLMPLYFLDFLLFLKGKFVDKMGKIDAFGVPQPDGTLKKPYEKIYDSAHLAMHILGKYSTEKNVVYFLLALQLVISLLVLVIFL